MNEEGIIIDGLTKQFKNILDVKNISFWITSKITGIEQIGSIQGRVGSAWGRRLPGESF